MNLFKSGFEIISSYLFTGNDAGDKMDNDDDITNSLMDFEVEFDNKKNDILVLLMNITPPELSTNEKMWEFVSVLPQVNNAVTKQKGHIATLFTPYNIVVIVKSHDMIISQACIISCAVARSFGNVPININDCTLYCLPNGDLDAVQALKCMCRELCQTTHGQLKLCSILKNETMQDAPTCWINPELPIDDDWVLETCDDSDDDNDNNDDDNHDNNDDDDDNNYDNDEDNEHNDNDNGDCNDSDSDDVNDDNAVGVVDKGYESDVSDHSEVEN